MKNYLRTKLLIIIFIYGFLVNLSAQSFSPFVFDNFAGVTAMSYNPATIADSRYKADIEMVGFNFNIENNWVKINKDILKQDFHPMNFDYFVDGKNKFLLTNVDARVFSFMVSLNEKNSFGISSRGRMIFNINNFPSDFTEILLDSINLYNLMDKHISLNDLSINVLAYSEFAGTYARVLLDEQPHFIKGGITLKYLKGYGAFSGYSTNLDIIANSQDSTASATANVDYQSSFDLADFKDISVPSSSGFGLDLGLVYEWRPSDDDADVSESRKDNKYKVRLSFSLLDFGSVNFKTDFGENLTANFQNLSLIGLETDSTDLKDTLKHYYTITPNGSESFKMGLPTTINFNVDYKIVKSIYLNLSGRFALNQINYSKAGVHFFNSYSITPRWESLNGLLGFALPIQYSQFGNLKLGFGARIYTFWIGSSDLLGFFSKEGLSGTDLSLAMKIPIRYKD